MDSNERVDRLDRDEVAFSVGIGMGALVDGLKTVDDCTELGGELVVGRVTTATVRRRKGREERGRSARARRQRRRANGRERRNQTKLCEVGLRRESEM
jgi:hypothetical protein